MSSFMKKFSVVSNIVSWSGTVSISAGFVALATGATVVASLGVAAATFPAVGALGLGIARGLGLIT